MEQAEGALTGWNAVVAELEARLHQGDDASITAEFTAPDGFRGFWGIWVHHDGTIRVTRDLVGSTHRTVSSAAEAVEFVSTALERLGASYWDSAPALTVDGSVRQFRPRVTYPALTPDEDPDNEVLDRQRAHTTAPPTLWVPETRSWLVMRRFGTRG